MISAHWSTIVLIIIEAVIIFYISKSLNEPKGDYGFDFVSPLLIIAGVAILLIWGGIFWW